MLLILPNSSTQNRSNFDNFSTVASACCFCIQYNNRIIKNCCIIFISFSNTLYLLSFFRCLCAVCRTKILTHLLKLQLECSYHLVPLRQPQQHRFSYRYENSPMSDHWNEREQNSTTIISIDNTLICTVSFILIARPIVIGFLIVIGSGSPLICWR